MAPLPKRKHSTRRKGKRRAAIKLSRGSVTAKQHRVDSEGKYKGIQILTPRKRKKAAKPS